MSNDIETIKGAGLAGRTSPTAKTGPGDLEAKAKQAEEKAKAEKAEQNPPVEDVAQEVAQGLNQLVHELHRELRFSVDHDSGETVIKVVDQETDEVVRQIPSEEVVALRKRLEEAAGVIFKDSA
jgi:flagellar protein FlaG